MQEDLRCDSTCKQFFEDVLIPWFHDELNTQTKLLTDLLKEQIPELLQHTFAKHTLQPPIGASEYDSLSVFLEKPETSHEAQKATNQSTLAETIAWAGGGRGRGCGSTSHELMRTGTEGMFASISSHEAEEGWPDDNADTLKPVSAMSERVIRAASMAEHTLRLRTSTRASLDDISITCLSNTVHSSAFRLMSSFLIVANSVTLGVHAQAELQQALSTSTWYDLSVLQVIDKVFIGVFTVELCLRILADGKRFFKHSWNVFDLVLVVTAVLNVISNNLPNFSFARMLRTVRFFRILRLFRVVRHIGFIRIMLHSLANSLLSLFWVFIMLLFVPYFFVMLLAHGIVVDYEASQLNEQQQQELQMHFGTVQKCLLSLFMAITGGKDWSDYYTPLTYVGDFWGCIWLLYMYIAVFGVLNIVTSMFVTASNQASLSDRDHVVQCEMDRNRMYMKSCQKFFKEADKDGSNKLTWKEFTEHLEKDQSRAHLATLELDESQARTLYTQLDVNQTNSILLEDFVKGCANLKGPAKATDLRKLIQDNQKYTAGVVHRMEVLQQKLEKVESSLSKASYTGGALDMAIRHSGRPEHAFSL